MSACLCTILFLNHGNYNRNTERCNCQTYNTRNHKSIQVSGLYTYHTCGTHGRTTPRHQIHNTVSTTHCSKQRLRTNSHTLTDRKKCRNHNQECGCTGTIQMCNKCGQNNRDKNGCYIFSGPFDQEIDDRIK